MINKRDIVEIVLDTETNDDNETRVVFKGIFKQGETPLIDKLNDKTKRNVVSAFFGMKENTNVFYFGNIDGIINDLLDKAGGQGG